MDGDTRVPVARAPLQASIADRMRIWETRKFCQVKPALVRYSREGRTESFDRTSSNGTVIRDEGDYALTAIARTLVYELDADVSMITLLDQDTQYFLSGAEKSSLSRAHSTLESTRWYGCDTIPHAGGLCPRTLGLHEGQILEELEMDQREHTKDLPIVNGTLSDFRHYAGVPLVTKSGTNIGTVFIFRGGSAKPLNTEQGEFLINTATQVMAHLEQAIRALEAQRMAKFNIAITSLLVHSQDHSDPKQEMTPQLRPPTRPMRLSSSSKGGLAAIADVYGQAANLMLESFEFEGVFIQEIPLRARTSNQPLGYASPHRADLCLAEAGNSRYTSSICLPDALARRLLQCWPSGEVLHLSTDLAGNSYFSSVGNGLPESCSSEQAELGIDLARCFPDVQQLIFTPLWDSLHSRAAAIAVGWVTDWSRIYTTTSDLSPIYAFCMTLMAQIRRFEAQQIKRRQTDFLGLISHEMRSPLHGNLASVELTLETSCTTEQRGLLLDALNSGRQLLDTIDKILEFSQISEGGPDKQSFSKQSLSATADDSTASIQRDSERHLLCGQAELTSLCESVIHSALSTKSSLCVKRLSSNAAHNIPHGSNEHSMGIDVTQQTVLVCLDVAPTPPVAFKHATAFQTILLNLLTNSIKNTNEGCISVRLDVDSPEPAADIDQVITVCITDTGIGIPQDFIDNRLFVPFSQVDQLSPGVGLGLPIVKQTVDSLGGNIRVDSNEATGTTVTVTLPWAGSQRLEGMDVKESNAISFDAVLPATSDDLPALCAQLRPSAKWSDSDRGRRCADLIYSSLARSLRNTVQAQLDPWDPDIATDLIIVLTDDLAGLRSAYSEQSDRPILLLGPKLDDQHRSQLKSNQTSHRYVVSETLTPNKLSRAFDTLFPDRFAQQRSNAVLSSGLISSLQRLNTEPRPMQNYEGGSDSGLAANMEAISETGREISSVPRKHLPDLRSETPQACRPRLLLVDDNAINLRVLESFVRKCSIESYATVTGGQEAITAFQSAIERDPGSSFSIIFMDLSMPQVSGFEATSTIRDIETRLSKQRHGDMVQPAYIVALTGLVSSKDRIAASDAGVDEYLTKPAGFKNIRHIVETWTAANRLRQPQLSRVTP